jgi:hypothetical protein
MHRIQNPLPNHARHDQIRSMSKFAVQIAQLILFASLVSACGETHKELAVSAGKADDNKPATDQKTSFDVPPLFSEQQLQVGQTIEWQRTAANGTTDCVQWKVTSINDSAGVSIEIRFSRKCASFDDTYRTERIAFNPADGVVSDDVIITGGVADANGPLKTKSLFAFHITGVNQKVNFLKTLWTLPFSEKKDQAAVFQIQKSLFYDEPGHPFHAFGLSFKYDDLQYQYKNSNPALKAAPKDL